ncbi:Arylsulfatase [Fusarium falciforme]|uniref:Arylsulfatase n=1 Tax=Fusarium falciforme TaxID=195108 RepID=UPI0022FFDD1A|nr:Arylsulfatase [Fusarium falciforme]WAO90725.1 Arylsulfatase [Fusarium falciforme]
MIFTTFGLCALLAPLAAATKAKPNIILILVDDQDVQMESLKHMPLLKQHMADEGTLYQSHYWYVSGSKSIAFKVNILTGKMSHNTNVTDIVAPYGGYPKFISQGLNDNYLPVWLQDAGYSTYYAGKLFNAHTTDNYDKPHAAGWTSSNFLLDPFTYSYWNATWQEDKKPPVSREGSYNTDDLAASTINYIRQAHSAGRPFFIGSAPIAPHTEVIPKPGTYAGNVSPDDPAFQPEVTPPRPAPRHANMFANLKVPRTPDFNPEKPSGVHWVAKLPRLNQAEIDYNDEFFRLRLQSLQAVDEMVERIVKELEILDILDNTYIIYTSDNGYHIGQHRLPPGKECGFETDINVPLLIRGPNVPRGMISDVMTSHTDLAPSIFRMAGIAPRSDFDGISVPLTREEMTRGKPSRPEHMGIEFWGLAMDEGLNGTMITINNTYKGIRLHSENFNLYYSVQCTNEHELYDMTVDPYQINNLLPSGANATGMPIVDYAKSKARIDGHSLLGVVSRLDALMMVMKSCRGETCIKPWNVLHPKGDVNTLEDALQGKYDDFYMRSAKENSVSFSMCTQGYLVGAEGLQNPFIYEGY